MRKSDLLPRCESIDTWQALPHDGSSKRGCGSVGCSIASSRSRVRRSSSSCRSAIEWRGSRAAFGPSRRFGVVALRPSRSNGFAAYSGSAVSLAPLGSGRGNFGTPKAAGLRIKALELKGRPMSLNRVGWAVLACRLHRRLRTYRCEAANRRFGPAAENPTSPLIPLRSAAT